MDSTQLPLILKETESVKQIAIADRIFIAEKTADLSSTDFSRSIEKLNPLADQLRFSHNQKITRENFFDLRKFHQTLTDLQTETHTDDEYDHHDHKHHHLDHEFQSLFLTTDQKINESRLMYWLDWLVFNYQERLYRFKGVVAIHGRDLACGLQGVNQQVAFQLTNEPADQTTLVLIGKGLDQSKIQKSFEELIFLSNN